MPKTEKLLIDVINGVEGPCLCVGNGETGRRVAGPKPWGGGAIIHQFDVDPKRLLEALQIYAPEVFDAKIDRWKKALEDLTPSGSEFVDDPEACARYVRRRMDSQFETIKRMKRQRDEDLKAKDYEAATKKNIRDVRLTWRISSDADKD